MRRALAAVFLFAITLTANTRLYLKDGTNQIVREYEVQGDRVHYYSVERSDWEDIPLDLVDLKRTEAEVTAKKEAAAEDVQAVQAEEKALRDQKREVSKIPQDPGVYQLIDGKELRILQLAESKVRNNKRRTVLKALSPIPIVSGKATLEIDNARANYFVETNTPEFYIQLATSEQFGIIKLTPKDDYRIAEKLTMIPVTKEVVEEPAEVEIFRTQAAPDGLYKIWPQKPLEPGEYAVFEATPGKVNMQIWDFAWSPRAKYVPVPVKSDKRNK